MSKIMKMIYIIGLRSDIAPDAIVMNGWNLKLQKICNFKYQQLNIKIRKSTKKKKKKKLIKK